MSGDKLAIFQWYYQEETNSKLVSHAWHLEHCLALSVAAVFTTCVIVISHWFVQVLNKH